MCSLICVAGLQSRGCHNTQRWRKIAVSVCSNRELGRSLSWMRHPQQQTFFSLPASTSSCVTPTHWYTRCSTHSQTDRELHTTHWRHLQIVTALWGKTSEILLLFCDELQRKRSCRWKTEGDDCAETIQASTMTSAG